MLIVQLVVALIVVAAAAWLVNTYVPMSRYVKLIVNLVLMLIVVGMALWLINTYVPMAGAIKAILNILVVAATCVGLLKALGLWSQVVGFWRNLTSHHVAGTDTTR
jgi:predicted membrane protein